MPKPWKYLLFEDREDGYCDLCPSLPAVRGTLDRLLKDGRSTEFLESLKVAKIQEICPVEVTTTREVVIGKPEIPS